MRRTNWLVLSFGLTIVCWLGVPARVAADTLSASGMVRIAGGTYAPLYSGSEDLKTITVKPFALDRFPVTNGDFLAFVTEHPSWRKSQVKRLFAEETYLQNWRDDLAYPDGAERNPVTHVSWFAAKAYCTSKAKRLPMTAEWEFAALASETDLDGRSDPKFTARILEWHSKPNPTTLANIGEGKVNYWGVFDLHGLIWEWVADFNSALITGESREDGSLNRDLYCGAGSTLTSEQAKTNYPAFLRAGFRGSLKGTYTTSNLGFRCARDL